MVRDILEMREYVQRELDGIEDRAVLHEMFCTVLRHRCIPYIKVRTAQLRQDSLQLKMFTRKTKEGKK